jgi:hypothetical protein
MSTKITKDNIKQYLEGNTNMLLAKLGQKPQWYLEQIAYRTLICKDDCWKVGTVKNGPRHCQSCGCDLPGKWYVTKSCNGGKKFPDIMNEPEWVQYKKENGI